MLDWDVDKRRVSPYTRIYIALMWLARDKRAFEGQVNTVEAALQRQRHGNRPPTWWTRRVRRVVTEHRHGMNMWKVRPRTGAPGARVLYLHGGGYVHPLTKDYWRLARALSSAPAEVVVPAYPLAPEATVDDVLPRLVDLAEELGRDQELPLVLMGDSAGGALVLSVALALRDRGAATPAGVVCLSPWLDAALGDERVAGLESTDPMLAESGLRAAGRWWAGARSPLDPRVSPLEADPAGLPPVDVYIGDRDILRPAVDDWAKRVAETDVDLHVHEVTSMFHVWMTRAIPEGRRTRRALVAQLRRRSRR